MTKTRFHKAVTKNREGVYEQHLFKGYPSIKYIQETLRGNGLKVNHCIAVDEDFFEQEVKTCTYLLWEREESTIQ